MSTYSIKQIRYYLAGMMYLPGNSDRNEALSSAICLIEDNEDGIQAVLDRRRIYNATCELQELEELEWERTHGDDR